MPVNWGYSHIPYFCTMKRNILALYLIKLSKWFTLVMPIIVLFYEKHGLGLQDVFILKSVYSVAAVALEIPSGYLADVWGRRKCLICGCILFFFGYLCYSFTSTFTAFLFAEILLGTGQTMVNGADSALLYDTTAQYKKENLYLRYEGRITMIGNFAEALAGIFGGLLAAYSLRFPFYGQAIIAFTGIPAAFALKEINRSGKIRNPVGEIVRIIKYSLVTNKKLCYNIMFSGIIGHPHDGLVRTAGADVSENARVLVWRHLDGTEPDGRPCRPLVRPRGQLFRAAQDGSPHPCGDRRRICRARFQPDIRRPCHPARLLHISRVCHSYPERIYQPDDLFRDEGDGAFHP